MIEILDGFNLCSGIYDDLVTKKSISPEGGIRHDSFSRREVLTKKGIKRLDSLLHKYQHEEIYYNLFRESSNLISAKFETPKYSPGECIECNNSFNSKNEVVAITFDGRNSSNYENTIIRLHKGCIQDFRKTLNNLLDIYNKKYIFSGIIIQHPRNTNENTIKVYNNSNSAIPNYTGLEDFMDKIKNTYKNRPVKPPHNFDCAYCYKENVDIYYANCTEKEICSNCLDKLAFRYLNKYKKFKNQNLLIKL